MKQAKSSADAIALGAILITAIAMTIPAAASTYPETLESRRALEANQEEANQIAAKRTETLARAAATLDAESGSAAQGSVLRLLDIAADSTAGPDLRQQAERLLERAAYHPNPSVALAAGRALNALRELAKRPRRIESQAEEGARAEQRRREKLQTLMERLGDPESPDRGLMANTFAMLATSEPKIEPDVYAFAGWMRRDGDTQVARWGEILTARVEGRAPDPELAPPYKPSPERLRLDREREQALIEQAVDINPQKRHQALRQLAEIALSEDRRADPKILAALNTALQDEDSRVSAYARFMIKGLAGDRHALGMVYVRGESPR